MPNLANIVVKKADGTTNYTFTALAGAPGDGVFAQWRGEGSTPALSADLRTKVVWNSKRNARRTEGFVSIPKVETVAGVPTVTSRTPSSLSITIPDNLTATEAADYVAITCNAYSSALIRQIMAEGTNAR